MKAIVYDRYGPPEVLRLDELPAPAPGAQDVLIQIRATTVTSGDARLRRADPFIARFFTGLIRPRKGLVLGSEFAGDVVSTGKHVQHFKVGDPVFGLAGEKMGAHAEYICLPEDGTLSLKPKNLTYEEAAAIPFGGHTALHFLRKGNIREGQKLMVYGASGSVGTAAVQLGKHFGAEVTGVCSNRNVELVRSIGADYIIDYTQENFSSGGHTYDIIFDTVGKSGFSACLASLADDGVYLRAVHMSAVPMIRGLWTSMTSSKKVIGGVARERQHDLVFLKDLAEAGKLKPVIDRSYPLDQIAEAHRYVDTGRKRGSVVITV